MDNRRKEYRHSFDVARPSAQLTRPGDELTLRGLVVSLSTGGMGVQFWPPISPDLPQGPWSVHLLLKHDEPPLHLWALLRHVQDSDGLLYGFQFLPPADQATWADSQRRIWAFLLEEQRRIRHQQRAS
jgi:c-di-GMP-binding flagellar brake protein YcgR